MISPMKGDGTGVVVLGGGGVLVLCVVVGVVCGLEVL